MCFNGQQRPDGDSGHTGCVNGQHRQGCFNGQQRPDGDSGSHGWDVQISGYVSMASKGRMGIQGRHRGL